MMRQRETQDGMLGRELRHRRVVLVEHSPKVPPSPTEVKMGGLIGL